MNQYAISTPEGTRDRLFAATRMFRQNEKRIRDLFEARGYDEIITPSLEYYDVFTQAGSSIGQEKMYKLTDRNGRLLVLRPDNTTPIARVVTTSSMTMCFRYVCTTCRRYTAQARSTADIQRKSCRQVPSCSAHAA